jgi:hypothetical protein
MFKKLLERLVSAPSPPAAAPAVIASDIPRADRLIDEGNEREDAGDLDGATALYR